MLKQQVFPMPEAITHLRAEAFSNGAPHGALHRRLEGLAAGLLQLGNQAVAPLADGNHGGGPSLDFCAPVGGQAVLLAVI